MTGLISQFADTIEMTNAPTAEYICNEYFLVCLTQVVQKKSEYLYSAFSLTFHFSIFLKREQWLYPGLFTIAT